MRIPSDSPKLKRIAVQAVQMRDLPMQEVTSPGQIDVNPNRLAHVGIPVPGRIASVAVRIGQAVRQGDPILTIESPDVDSAISTRLQAEANMTQAQAAARKAQADADRIRDLFEHEAAARKDLLNAEAQLVEAQSSLEQARVAATQARRRLEMFGVNAAEFGQRMTVRAPISGKVLEMNVVPGEFRTDTAASVATIADLASVWVTADVPETAIRLIQIGEALTVELAAYPGETFRARVTQIADTVDPQTRSVKVRAELANAHGRLRPEMFGRIRHVEGSTRQPVVPVAAVVEDGRQYVWKEIQPGIFERIAVQTGIRSRGLVAITAGLSEGDRVVVGGVMLLSAEGMK
ncbi:MAG TPA: efflux RND transporter periplasmic adaptor subunit [Bryobacteraceae bacterium]|nr:efflux RND transporter periplasmic adaptor subunit [Bryobacteraceae bacterium]